MNDRITFLLYACQCDNYIITIDEIIMYDALPKDWAFIEFQNLTSELINNQLVYKYPLKDL